MSAGRFTQAFKNALSEYTSHLLRMFELTDWRVILLDAPAEGTDVMASIAAVYGQKYANLRLCHDWFDYHLDKQEHALIHEVCHLFSEGINNVIDNGPEILMGKPAFTMFNDQYRVQMELMTDQLAHCFQWFLKGGPEYDRLLAAVDKASRGELPPPKVAA